ncbi:hypothetical protein [Legionella jamestowniensis]|uniref:Uncharacterized protein n=1 Tax=Legionella jamestowniensis TaxID=455 RepID=A0A0W0UJI8_9GAMM|nr:hypothetical protein [Legionella jamestowniensis]KTD07789.1 hypothetical protein Ljam_1984 [Legionella jamestowniensis]OCH99520.1 hypothetical protein A8135_07530 [Legionella jamestowniensis]SFL62208.1 hypothetical protein SAMN02746073_1108 [Legionella jamestowniensis DSM 19215]
MFFFKAKDSSQDYAALLQKETSLQAWWQKVRDKNTLSFLYSYQTKQLDASIAKLSQLIENYETERAEVRRKALHKLYLQVCNWQHMHVVKRQASQRVVQMEVLANWLKDQISNDLAVIVLPKDNLYKGVEIADQNLYRWWKAMSNLGWFSRRSAATKELDKAIEWFSNSIILDRLRGLEELMAAIEVWKDERQEVSRRLPMVEALQQQIAQQIEGLQAEGQLYEKGPRFSFPLREMAFMAFCYLQELFEGFDSIFEISSLLLC